MIKYLGALNVEDEYLTNIGNCFSEIMSAFTKWMTDLCISSLIEAYGSTSNGIFQHSAEAIINNPHKLERIEDNNETYIEYNQDNLGEEVEIFFNNYTEQGKYGNELWLYKRVNAVVNHILKKIDLFSQKEEIRRSIIYCSKSCNQHFIISLNNKLSQKRS
jgi:hypothetical protein